MYVLFLVFAIFAVALNIVFGHTEQLFLFVGRLAGISAYSTSLVAKYRGTSPWVTLLPSAVLVGLIGALVSYTVARRKVTVIVIAILTLTLQRAIIEIFVGALEITGGSTGYPFTELALEPVQSALNVTGTILLYYLLAAILTLTLLFYRRLMHSKVGLAFEMLRQDEIGGEAVGIDVIKYKTIAGFIAAFIIGFTAPIYVQLEGYILPSLFAFHSVDVLVLIMLIIGRLRTMYGPVLRAAVVLIINEELAGIGQWRTVVFGALLVVLFLYFREESSHTSGIYVEPVSVSRGKSARSSTKTRTGTALGISVEVRGRIDSKNAFRNRSDVSGLST